MRKIYKNINMAVVFMAIGMVLCQDFAYPLRVPLDETRIEQALEESAEPQPASRENVRDTRAMQWDPEWGEPSKEAMEIAQMYMKDWDSGTSKKSKPGMWFQQTLLNPPLWG